MIVLPSIGETWCPSREPEPRIDPEVALNMINSLVRRYFTSLYALNAILIQTCCLLEHCPCARTNIPGRLGVGTCQSDCTFHCQFPIMDAEYSSRRPSRSLALTIAISVSFLNRTVLLRRFTATLTVMVLYQATI